MAAYKVKEGFPTPLGVSQSARGHNFALLSAHAQEIELRLFQAGEKAPFFSTPLKQSGTIWHALIEKLEPPFEYGFHIDGHLLLDPYAREVNTCYQWRSEELDYSPRGVVTKEPPFKWEKDLPPRIPLEEMVIYEMHVRAFTQHPTSGAAHPGTFLGVIDKIPYLKRLGINAVELMPVCEFNEKAYDRIDPTTQAKLCNFWGYSTVNFFSPMNRFGVENTRAEFKRMVKELHKQGIEVLLDMVFNHTGEGGGEAPPLSFRGIDNTTYYMHDAAGNPLDFTGTGNNFNCNHPDVIRLILDALRYWIEEMHVDGFRFDLASIFTRSVEGMPLDDPPLLKAIKEDPLISKVKLIAEAWDAAGLYQLGRFPAWGPWSEWNGRFRDVVRRFIKGTAGEAGAFATALSGSQDLYGAYEGVIHSINFITAHDGFTLADLVSFQEKHNLRNGEENRDGMNENESWNCGAEGATKTRKVLQLREQQARNFQLALFVSLGPPMLLMGDEHLHTREGNNNAWCQDNALNWIRWDQEHAAFERFVRLLIQMRKKSPLLQRRQFLTNEEVSWHGHMPHQPDWSHDSRFVAYTLNSPSESYYIAFNAYYEPAKITLPPSPKHASWFRKVDTARASPEDIVEHAYEGTPIRGNYRLAPYSAVLFTSH